MIKKFCQSESLAIGLAMFSMFFGAGNVIFPLVVGKNAGEDNLYAMLGLILTAAIMPIAGVIAMILFEGNYKQFFGRLGRAPGFWLALVIISLLGPLGSTPRCIALAYSTIKSSFPGLSTYGFSAIACLLIFLFTVKKHHILHMLGYVLTPILLASLVTIIVIGLLTPPAVSNNSLVDGSAFLYGLQEGYNTMDLLAAFFFSSTILTLLKVRSEKGDIHESRCINIALRASLVGAFLLAMIYIGFSYLAAFHGGQLTIQGKDELLAAITLKIAGEHAGPLVCLTIVLACLTTAIALISAFADFIQQEVFHGKVKYEWILAVSLALTYFVSIFEFNGISAFLEPVLLICYPGLIVLTFLNIAYRLKAFQPIKVPVFGAFGIAALLYFI